MQIPDPSANVEEKAVSEDTDTLLSSVSETDRSIMIMRSGGMSWKEVAVRVSMTESNVRKRFERARKKVIEMRGEK